MFSMHFGFSGVESGCVAIPGVSNVYGLLPLMFHTVQDVGVPIICPVEVSEGANGSR
jgi:hypothetical protein